MATSNGTSSFGHYLKVLLALNKYMYSVAFSRGSPANDAQLAPSLWLLFPRQCVPKQKARAQALALTSSSPTFQQPEAATTTPQQQHPHLPRPTAPQSPTSPLATALVSLSHLPQHYSISLLSAEFRYPSALSVPLRRLTHISPSPAFVFTISQLPQPSAHSLRVPTTSPQQPIRLAGDTRPPPA